MSKLLVKTLPATIKKMEKLFFSNQNMKNSPHGPSDLLLVLNCSWILTRNKVRNLRKKLLKNLFLTFQNGVKSIQTAGYNGKPTVLSGFFPYCLELPIWPKIHIGNGTEEHSVTSTLCFLTIISNYLPTPVIWRVINQLPASTKPYEFSLSWRYFFCCSWYLFTMRRNYFWSSISTQVQF